MIENPGPLSTQDWGLAGHDDSNTTARFHDPSDFLKHFKRSIDMFDGVKADGDIDTGIGQVIECHNDLDTLVAGSFSSPLADFHADAPCCRKSF